MSLSDPVRIRNLEYTRAEGQPLLMDGEVPAGRGPYSAVLMVHGGGWMRGDRSWNLEPLFAPLSEAGLAWFSISYRLARDFLNIGEAAHDIRAAVGYLRQNAARFRIDARRVGLLGESAGAHLAALATLAEPSSVAALVSLAGPHDLERLALTSSAVPAAIRDAVTGSGLASLLLGHLRSLSPVHLLRPGMRVPPVLLVHGAADTIVPFEQSELLQRSLSAHGFSADLLSIPGAGHLLRTWESAMPGWRRAVAGWLQHRLGEAKEAA